MLAGKRTCFTFGFAARAKKPAMLVQHHVSAAEPIREDQHRGAGIRESDECAVAHGVLAPCNLA